MNARQYGGAIQLSQITASVTHWTTDARIDAAVEFFMLKVFLYVPAKKPR